MTRRSAAAADARHAQAVPTAHGAGGSDRAKADSIGGVLARCQRLAEQHFPTESLLGNNIWRGQGLPDGHQMHDIYNLVTLPVLCAFCFRFLQTGESFLTFVRVAYGYFVGDLLWVVVNPSCVKSPGVISAHHCLTMAYMLYPVLYPQLRYYMAMCLTVELNTFFLILRRIWHVPPVSVCFYLTWISIRLLIYPYLIYVFALLYKDRVRTSLPPEHATRRAHPTLRARAPTRKLMPMSPRAPPRRVPRSRWRRGAGSTRSC